MIISKLDAAQIQLDSAIDHFFQGDHVCAVTLAGAAEDIFAGLLNEEDLESAFQFLYNWYQKTYNKTVSKSYFSQQILNLVRNWLKHSDADTHTQIDITERDSIMMLMRALPCYFKLANSHTEKMKRFYKYVKDNQKEIDKLFS